MPLYDLPGEQLVNYMPNLVEPKDLDNFWATTLAEARANAKPAAFEPVECGLTLVDCFDVTYSGFGGDPVRAWLHLPSGASAPMPMVVRYLGYGGGRGLPHEVSPVAPRRLWLPDDGHPGPGVRVEPGRTRRTRGSHTFSPGVYDKGDTRPPRVLLPQGLHGRRPRRRGGPQPPDSERADRLPSPAPARVAA